MKTSTLLLVVSLAANGALIAAVALNSPASRPASARPSAAAGAAAGAAVAPGSAVSAARVPVANLWSRLHAGSLDEFRDRLRAAGFPSRAVRIMLSTAIDDEQRERWQAISGRAEDTPYWKLPRTYGNDPEHQAQIAEVSRETRELFYKYVGGAGNLAEDENELLAAKRRYGNLPLEKLQQLAVLEHDIEVKRMALSGQYNGTGPAPDAETMRRMRESMQALEQSRFTEAAKLLAPDELEQYELRNSPTAGGLRMQLAAFNATEAEFKALYALRKNAETAGGNRDDYMAQLQAALGPERAADYEVAVMSGGGDKLPRLIARLELPLSTIKTINTVRTDINQRAQIITQDAQLTAPQREAQLATLAQEADQRLTSTLGARGYEAYADLKGEWIRALKPKKK